jgi:hypothetical protein
MKRFSELTVDHVNCLLIPMSFGIVLRESTLALVMLTKRCSNAVGSLVLHYLKSFGI